MQHEMKEGPLLDQNGNLVEPGFAYHLCKNYNRENIKTSKFRIKEWDYYYVGNAHYAVAFTVADNNYMSLVGATFFDFDAKKEVTKNSIHFFSMGRWKLPRSSKEGTTLYNKGKYLLKFTHENGKRHLVVHYPKFSKCHDLDVDLFLEETNESSMVIATPFKKPKHFYYNQKINLLKSTGSVSFDGNTYDFSHDYYGVLDWGRGVWTYQNTWYWASLNSLYQGRKIGFNLGYGFGDTSAASENMFFYHDKAYKLNDVTFNIPKIDGKDDYLSTWTLTSKTGDINLTFKPILNRSSHSSIGIIASKQNQVFGRFSGTIKLKDETVTFENLIGFAEKVFNRW